MDFLAVVLLAFAVMATVCAVAWLLREHGERRGQVDLSEMLSVYSDEPEPREPYEVTPGLEGCPFCDSGATVLKMDYGGGCVWGVFCLSDLNAKYSHGHFVDNYPTREAAVEAWNRRYPLG